MSDNYTVLNSCGVIITMKSKDVGGGVQSVQSVPTDTSGTPMLVLSGSAVTSSMSAMVVAISSLSANHVVTLSSAPAFAISSAVQISSGTVTLSSNPTVIASSAINVTLTSNTVTLSSGPSISSISSGSFSIVNGANTANVVAGSSAVTSTMSALVVALSTLGNFSVTTSSQIQITNGTNTANVIGPSSVVTSTMPALVVALSSNGFSPTISTITSITSGAMSIINGANTVTVKAANSGAALVSDVAIVATLRDVNPNGQATMANSAPVTIASNQSAITVTISSAVTITGGGGGGSSVVAISSGTITLSSATTPKNFLWQVSAGSSGLLVSAVTVISSELVSLASSVATVGVTTFGSSNTGQGIWADVFLTFGTTATTLSGANYAGWFLPSLDGGTTFESTANLPLARPPDFVIPVPVATLGSSLTYKSNGLVRIPPSIWKVSVQNNTGIITASSSNGGYPLVRITPYAEQY